MRISGIFLLACFSVLADSQKEKELQQRLDLSIQARQRDNERAAAQLAGLTRALEGAVLQTKRNAEEIKRIRGPLADIATVAEPVKEMAATVEQTHARLEQAAARAAAIDAVINRIEKSVNDGFVAQRNIILVYGTVFATVFLISTVLVIRHMDNRAESGLSRRIVELEAHIDKLTGKLEATEEGRNGPS